MGIPLTPPALRTLLASTVISLAFVAHVLAADVTGPWGLEFERSDSNALYQAECNFKQEGDRISGSCLSGFESIVPVRGRINGAGVTFEFPTGVEAATTVTFSGQLDAKETVLKGTWRSVDQQGSKSEGTFTATKR